MRFSIFVLLVACSRIAVVEPIYPSASNPEERCIQTEMRCLDESSAGSVVIPIATPLVILTKSLPGDIIVRHCELQGKLCRLRSGVAQTPASQPVKSSTGLRVH